MDNFAKAIDARRARGEKMETTSCRSIRRLSRTRRLNAGIAQITVRFAAKAHLAHARQGGAVIEGSADAVVDHLDIWTFSRDTGSRDPNWQLSATETVH